MVITYVTSSKAANDDAIVVIITTFFISVNMIHLNGGICSSAPMTHIILVNTHTGAATVNYV